MSESSSGSSFTYRAFISYSHADKAWADWLHKSLETYRVPSRLVGKQTEAGVVPRRLNPVFRDREDLATATDLGRTVNAALAQSENLIVICSPASATSHWVNEEVLAYKRMGRGERIFCLIVEGEPNAGEQRPDSFVGHSRESGNPLPPTDTLDPQARRIPDIATRFRDDGQEGLPGSTPGREAEECFCPALRFATDADGRPTSERTEPIAADAREGKDGKANAKLKLIAGMLGVGFDALKQREQHRKMQRLVAIAATAVVVMAATIVLAVYALISRHEAITAQHQAMVAQQAAERHQKQAEGLVDFMLGDLNDKLAQVQRLDIMEAVDDKAMAYFESLPIADATPTALAQRATALTKIGRVRQNQGHQTEALASFEAAAKLAAGLANATPTDATPQLQYARILAFIGQAHWLQGQLDAAQKGFDAARNTLLRVEPQASHDLTLTFELEMIDNDLGHVYEARGQLDEAVKAYGSALELSQKLVAAKPDNIDWQVALGGAHNNLGKLALLHGNLATSIAEYTADDKIESALAASDPRNNTQRDGVLTVHAILGRTLAQAGADRTGIQYLEQAVQTAAALVQFDPVNTGFQDDLALYSVQLARLKRLNGDPASAQSLTARSLSILARLVHQDPTNSYFQSDLASTQTEQAAEFLASGNVETARNQGGAALRTLGPLLARQPNDRGLLLAKLETQLLLAKASVDPVSAAQLRNEVADTARAQSSGRSDPRLLALQAEALLGLGRKDDARPLLRQLWGSGYRDAGLLATLKRERIAYPINATFQQKLLLAGGKTRKSGGTGSTVETRH